MRGLYNKYIITKSNGNPIDPNAKYIVLRYDSGEYVEACRKGIFAFAEAIKDINPKLSWDIQMELLGYIAKEKENSQPPSGER